MNKILKQTKGLLFNDEDEYVAEAKLIIALEASLNPSELSKYSITASVDGYRPDLDNKVFKLSLSKDLSGKIFLTIDPKNFPSTYTTFFIVYLQDEIWNNLEWFKLI